MKPNPSDSTRLLVLKVIRGTRSTPSRLILKLKNFPPPPGETVSPPRLPLTALGEIMNDLRVQLEPKAGA